MKNIFKKWADRYFSDPQILTLAILLVVSFAFIYALGRMLTPVIAAVIIAYLLESPASRLERFKLPRNLSVLLVFIVFMAFLLALLILLLPALFGQISQFLQDLPSMVKNGQVQLMGLPERYPDIISQSQIKEVMDALMGDLTNMGQRLLSFSLSSVKGLITILVYLVLVPLLVFFFLKDKKKIIVWLQKFLPKESGMAADVWKEVNLQVANYVRGKIWEIFIVGMVSYIVFLFLGLKFASLLAVIVGLSVIVPYIGATVVTIPVGVMAFFQWGFGHDLAWTLIAYGIIQALDGNLLVPLLLSGVVNLHPVAIIVAVLVFGGLWGIWGLFFAIPLATLVHAVIRAWFSRIRDMDEKKEAEKAAC